MKSATLDKLQCAARSNAVRLVYLDEAGFAASPPLQRAWSPRGLTSFTRATRSYTAEEFRALSLQYIGKSVEAGHQDLHVRIVNSGSQVFAAYSMVNTPIRASWRFLDATGAPLSGWDSRQNVPFDIPAHGSEDLALPIDGQFADKDKTVEVSLVQEGVFWAYDIGVKPLRIDLGQK